MYTPEFHTVYETRVVRRRYEVRFQDGHPVSGIRRAFEGIPEGAVLKICEPADERPGGYHVLVFELEEEADAAL